MSLDGGWSVFESSNSFSLSSSEVGGIVKQLPGDLLFADDTSSLPVIPYPRSMVCLPSPLYPHVDAQIQQAPFLSSHLITPPCRRPDPATPKPPFSPLPLYHPTLQMPRSSNPAAFPTLQSTICRPFSSPSLLQDPPFQHPLISLSLSELCFGETSKNLCWISFKLIFFLSFDSP